MKNNSIIKLTSVLILLFLFLGAPAQSTYCPTDFNRDAKTDMSDFAIFLAQYGQICTASPCPTDLNGDGVTNTNDYLIFSAAYGSRCDAIIFGISTATFSNGYVDIPVTLSANGLIYGFDFELKFNENKLTFDTMLPISLSGSLPAWHFNQNDRFLRFTTSIFPGAYSNDVNLVTLRFSTMQTSLTNSDLSQILTIITTNIQSGALRGYFLK